MASLSTQPGSPSATSPGTGEPVVLRAYDARGNHRSRRELRARREHGRGPAAAEDDVLVDPVTLCPLAVGPLHQVGDDLALEWPGRPAALAMTWQAPHGRDQLILDLPGPGLHLLDLLAARQALAALDLALVEHGLQPPRGRLRLLVDAAERELARADRTGRESQRGAAAARSVRAAQAAVVELRAVVVGGREKPEPAWMRLVVDADVPPSGYRAAVERAHDAGTQVACELVAPSELTSLSEARFRARVEAFVAALPAVDAFVVGDEVNAAGGREVADRVAFAAAHVKTRSSARALVTLAWEPGYADPQRSTFGWLDRQAVALSDVDDVVLTVRPDGIPLGASRGRVLGTLHRSLPGKRIVLAGGDSADARPVRRTAVTRVSLASMTAFPLTGGGAHWWYLLDDAPRRGPLWKALRNVRARG